MRRGYLYYLLFTGLLFSPFLLFGQVFVPGDVLGFLYPWRANQPGLPQNIELFDVTVFFYPQDVFYNASLKAGEFPLWNPQIFGGHPVVASGQSGFLYPLRALLHWLFSVGTAKTWLQILHFLGMGFAMRYFLRVRGFSEFPSTLGGLAWMGNSQVLSWLEFEHVPIAGFYLPLMLVALEKGLRGSKAGWLGLPILGSLALHSGHLQIVTYIGLLFGFYTVVRLWQERPQAGIIGWLALSSFLTLGLAAPTVLPFLDFLGDSQRVPLDPAANAASLGSLLLSTLCPDIWGNPSLGFMLNRCQTNLIYPEFACFVGSVPLVFALAAKGRSARLLQGLCVLILLLAAAAFSVTLPLLDRFVPGRILLILVFLLSYLAAMGAEQSSHSPSSTLKPTAIFLAVVWGVASLTAISYSLRPEDVLAWAQANPGTVKLPPLQSGLAELSSALEKTYLWNPQIYLPFVAYGLLFFRSQKANWLLAFTLLELLMFGYRFNPSVSPQSLFPSTAEIQSMQGTAGRVVSVKCANYNTLTPYGLRRVNGYESLVDSRYGTALNQAEPERALSMRALSLERLDSPILDALSLEFALLPPQSQSPGAGWVPHFSGEGGTVWKNEQTMPRAYFVGEVRPFRAPADLRSLEPARFAYSSGMPPEGYTLRSGASRVDWTKESANHLVLDVESQTDQFLVLTDTYREGWRCWVDGVETPVLAANLCSRGVYLKSGRHRLEWRFEPPSFYLGLKLAGVAGVVWLLIFGKIRTRQDFRESV